MKLCRGVLAISILIAALMGAAFAQEGGTPQEAKQMVDEAIAHVKAVGAEKAFQDFNTHADGKWFKKDLYVFCYKSDGTCVCNGDNKGLLGKNLLDLKYPDGQTHIRNMVEIAKTKGSGWEEYPWPHPLTKKIQVKRAYVTKIPGYDGFLAVGVYK